jgi:hypothetical protein
MRTVTNILSVLMLGALLGACSGSDDSTGGSEESAKGARLCGNGKIDLHEQCDKTDFGGETCSSVTLGAKPAGKLECSRKCTFDTSSCVAAGTGGTGGTGTGGTGGTGTGGTGGSTAGTGGV